MALPRTLRLVVNPGVRPELLPLGPQEYFVLSRIERSLTVAEIIGASGLGASPTEQILETLIQLGAIKRDEAAPSPPPGESASPGRSTKMSTGELRAQAAERRRRMLTQQLGHGRARASTPATRSATPPEPEAEPPEAEVEAEPEPPIVPPVAADDPRLDDSLGLSLEVQRHLLALEDRRGELTPFELLGLRPTHDLKAIRTAFREASRRLHPDAYHGRTLGRFESLLSALFVEAKHALADLQREEVRLPLVAAGEARAKQQRRRQAQREAARRAAQELRRRKEDMAAQERRQARTHQRAERDRERLAEAVRAKVSQYLEAAAQAEEIENFARAANNYRLALQLDPNNDAVRTRWQEVRTIARTKRAKDAFALACNYMQVGHGSEAVVLFLEAAESDPTVEHLAHAADAVRERDPGRGRDLAMNALRLLSEQDDGRASLRPSAVADLRLMIGRAFLTAGLAQSAREQAKLVQKLRPGDPAARALLNSAKVT